MRFFAPGFVENGPQLWELWSCETPKTAKWFILSLVRVESCAPKTFQTFTLLPRFTRIPDGTDAFFFCQVSWKTGLSSGSCAMLNPSRNNSSICSGLDAALNSASTRYVQLVLCRGCDPRTGWIHRGRPHEWSFMEELHPRRVGIVGALVKLLDVSHRFDKIDTTLSSCCTARTHSVKLAACNFTCESSHDDRVDLLTQCRNQPEPSSK